MGQYVLKVQMLGGFSLIYGDVTVSDNISRSYKPWLLLAYLIYHRDRFFSQKNLLRLLDADGESANPAGALKSTILRARRALAPLYSEAGCEFIVYSDGAYGWNPTVEVELDAERFEALCRAGEEESDHELRLGFFRQALNMGRGEFLPRYAGEAWVSSVSAYYRQLYIHTVEEMLQLMKGAKYAPEAVALCRAALQASPYHDSLCRHLMRSLAAMRDYGGAETAYKEFQQRLFTDLGVEPEEATRDIYQKIVGRLGEQYVAPDVIRDQLREKAPPNGAMVCDYATFKMFYQAEARAADRRGDAIHIGVLSVAGRNGKKLSPQSLEQAMEQLKMQLQLTLRIGDIAACCSASQYLIMLVQANYENSLVVCDRVIRAYERAYPGAPVTLRSAVLPLEPLFGG